MAASTEVWQRWLEVHAGRLLLFARQQCCAADAEDLLQEALVEAWSRGVAADGSARCRWCTARSAGGRSIRPVRSSADRRQRREIEASALGPAWFESDEAAGDDARETQELVATLPAEQREVLTMKIWGELTFREIGEALDIPANTAASRYRYALEALRKTVEERHERRG